MIQCTKCGEMIEHYIAYHACKATKPGNDIEFAIKAIRQQCAHQRGIMERSRAQKTPLEKIEYGEAKAALIALTFALGSLGFKEGIDLYPSLGDLLEHLKQAEAHIGKTLSLKIYSDYSGYLLDMESEIDSFNDLSGLSDILSRMIELPAAGQG